MKYLAVALLLSGCSTFQLNPGLISDNTLVQKISEFAIADLQNALKIANAEDDTTAQVCINRLLVLANYAKPTPDGKVGLFTAIEIVRAFRRNNTQQDCTAFIASF